MESLKKQIEKYVPYNEQEEVDKKIILQLMDKEENLVTRENKVAHFTTGVWVVNKQKTKVLMAYHNIYDSWAWLGGHSDGEEDLLKVAIKEAKEEAGLKKVIPVSEDIFSLEVLPVRGHEKKGEYVSTHLHLNVTYLLETDEELEEISPKEDENKAVKWIKLEEVGNYVTEDWMQERIYTKLVKKMIK